MTAISKSDAQLDARIRDALARMKGLDYKYGGWWRDDDNEWTSEEDTLEEQRLALHDLLVAVREAYK